MISGCLLRVAGGACGNFGTLQQGNIFTAVGSVAETAVAVTHIFMDAGLELTQDASVACSAEIVSGCPQQVLVWPRMGLRMTTAAAKIAGSYRMTGCEPEFLPGTVVAGAAECRPVGTCQQARTRSGMRLVTG